jgi:HEAT repeat protein
MTQPSKPAAAFLALFGLPFLGGGLFFISVQLARGRNFETGNTILGVMAGLGFAVIGAGFMYAAIGGYGRLKKQAAIEESNPLSPWLWRTDWASRRAESLNKKTEITYWVICIFSNMILLPVVGGLAPKMVRSGDPRAFLLLGFGLIGVILLANAIRATIRHRRFGNTYLEFNSLPFSPGDRAGGRIHLKLETQAAHGIDLRLSCVRRVVTGSGDSRTTREAVLWQAEQNVPSGAVSPGPLGRMIPVDFALPAGAYVTNHDNPNDQVLWLLHAQADVPGVDYSDDFELPVFGSVASAETARFSQSPGFSGADAAGFPSAPAEADSSAVAQPARTKVIVSTHSGGTEFYFPAFRNPGRAGGLFVFTLIWSGVVYFLYSHAPLFFFVVFGLFDLLLIFGVFHVTLGSARIGVANGEILSRTGILGLGSTRRIPVSDVASLVPVVSMQQSGASGNALHAIRLRMKNGRKYTLADEIDSRQEARWVVAQIETLAGLKLDTHVEVDATFGVSSPPPQPGTGQVFTRPQPPKSVAASIAGFAVIALAMFAWVFWRTPTRASRVNGTRTAAASRPNPVSRRVFSMPMTDTDVERVLALPAQDQAEELLERAIGHDERALELFDQHVEGWIGHIRMSDRMRQLERRSEYSRDLRVRYANADINLALDGWQKNGHAADLLIERAHTDQHYRAAAVYFLGMLAGRGVDYDRIHSVLLDYARNDKDPTVRQWAVEGMRYLGKDEVLDELFTSFTEDPARTVRDRAGCNISDCGNFMRKQRMRMVPKFIDLAMNSRTNSQMRNWCFMALQEITDERLPADALVWSRWYQEHGAEKMAELERLDWWQVRGNE